MSIIFNHTQWIEYSWNTTLFPIHNSIVVTWSSTREPSNQDSTYHNQLEHISSNKQLFQLYLHTGGYIIQKIKLNVLCYFLLEQCGKLLFYPERSFRSTSPTHDFRIHSGESDLWGKSWCNSPWAQLYESASSGPPFEQVRSFTPVEEVTRIEGDLSRCGRE